MSVTLEQLEAFLREPPPRNVPPNILRRRLRHSLGWFGYLFGAFFFAFGSLFVVIFFPWRLAEELSLDLGSPARAMAAIVACEKTSMEVNESPVYRASYQFQTADGQQIAGTCYVTGKRYTQGETVVAEYVADKPEWNRLEGGHVNPFGYFGVFAALFPLVGGVVFWLSWGAHRRAVQLLRHGQFALGRVKEVQATNVTVNDQQRFRVLVEYEAAGQPWTARYHAYGEDVELARRHQANGEEIGLLYDPERPHRVLFAESLLG